MSHDPKNTKLLLLSGGWTYEEKNSLKAGLFWEEILENMGYTVVMHNPQLPDLSDLKKILSEDHFDIVFHSLYGPFFEGGQFQTFLDTMQIKYTHSASKAGYIQQNKHICKQVVAEVGVPIIEGVVCKFYDIRNSHPLKPPYVVKPTNEGSSVGLNVIYEDDGPIGTKIEKWHFDECLVEKYVSGVEITVLVFGKKAVGVAELILDSKDKFFSWDAKYSGNTEAVIPARIPPAAIEKAMRYAELAHQAVGCRTISRSDFLYDEVMEKVYFLELNSHPGHPGVRYMIEHKDGISIDEVAFQLIEDGLNS